MNFSNYSELFKILSQFDNDENQGDKNKELISAQNSRIKYFFSDAGVRSCYFKMKKEGRIPPLWSEVIERAM